MAKEKPDQTTADPLEIERLRLQNENLKLQLEIENKRNPKTPDQLIEEQQAKARAAERQALDELAGGTSDKPLPFKFHVTLPGNYPTTSPRHAPHLVVGASAPGEHGAREAAARFNAHMGIVSTDKRHAIVEVGRGEVQLAEAVPAIDFTPVGGVEQIA